MENENKSTNNTEAQPTDLKADIAKSEAKFSIDTVGSGDSPVQSAPKIQPYNKINTIMVIVLSISIVGLITSGVYLYMQKKGSSNPSDKPSESHSMLPPGLSGDSNNPIENITLNALPPFTGTASASRIYKDHKFTVTISAKTSPPPAGKYYEGWVNNNSHDPSYISIGKLEKMGDDYMLEHSTDNDYMPYNSVFITEESESLGSDSKPEAHMFHGDF